MLSFFPVCRFFSGTGGWAVPDFPPALTFTGFSSFVPPAFTFAGFRPFDSPPAPEPEYRTVVSACNIRSYPDYGDNVIGGLYGGETVLFYGLEEGWDKIEYNGIVGYIGPKFLR